jgi:hypothetical protein
MNTSHENKKKQIHNLKRSDKNECTKSNRSQRKTNLSCHLSLKVIGV